MRPLTLAIDGLRSYRHRVEVDFTDVDLVGIVGDTGAGKSSLLEGLCVALYNGSTWDARGAKALIADGADVLRVELTFRADDATWLVRRAISKGAYPPPIHSLECLDDGRKFDGADAVLTEVKRLVGVDFNGFLKAVVLPQGRFQVLLQSSQSDRTTILKNILRVDQLGTCARSLPTGKRNGPDCCPIPLRHFERHRPP
jgi:exonuclease SbcC